MKGRKVRIKSNVHDAFRTTSSAGNRDDDITIDFRVEISYGVAYTDLSRAVNSAIDELRDTLGITP